MKSELPLVSHPLLRGVSLSLGALLVVSLVFIGCGRIPMSSKRDAPHSRGWDATDDNEIP